MANAFLYYRTLTTRTVDTSPTDYSDPNNLPAAQKLFFDAPDDHANGIEEDWTNNIVRKIPAKPKGRKILQRDEGVSGWNITLSGYWKVGSGDSETKLHNFRKLLQEDDYHVFGVFGLQYPNGPGYLNIDPTDKKGLMITGTRGKHLGNLNTVFDFSVGVSHGGDL